VTYVLLVRSWVLGMVEHSERFRRSSYYVGGVANTVATRGPGAFSAKPL